MAGEDRRQLTPFSLALDTYHTRYASVGLLDTGPSRAGVFFFAGLLVSTAFGVSIGEPRLGVTTGLAAGLALALFGWVFVRPA